MDNAPHNALRAAVARSLAEGSPELVEIPDARVKFFYDHAGYSWRRDEGETEEQGHVRCALALADAELWAEAAPAFRVEWEDDWIVGSHVREFGDSYDAEPDTCEVALAYVGADVVASLGCIDDADDNYRRVVNAELADEARALLIEELGRI